MIERGIRYDGKKCLLFNGLALTEDLLARSCLLRWLMGLEFSEPVTLPISELDYLMWSEYDGLHGAKNVWTLQQLACLAEVRQRPYVGTAVSVETI